MRCEIGKLFLDSPLDGVSSYLSLILYRCVALQGRSNILSENSSRLKVKKAAICWFPNSSLGTMNRKLLLPLYSYNVTCSKSVFSLLVVPVQGMLP